MNNALIELFYILCDNAIPNIRLNDKSYDVVMRPVMILGLKC